MAGGLATGAPPKITSCIDCPRTAAGDCSPSAHRTASVTLDLPDPLGPTITLTPGPNSSRVRSGNDLKPLTVIDFRYMGSPGGRVRSLGSSPPAPTGPPPALRPSCSGRRREPISRPWVVALTRNGLRAAGPVPGTTVVADQLAATGQPFLQGRLVVDRVLQGVADLRLECRLPPPRRSRRSRRAR